MDQNADGTIFSAEEKDILQEIMNIAFGNATADLAGIIDIYVVLSIPKIQVLNVGALPKYLKKTLEETSNPSIVDQKFWGDFSGSGFLVFPGEAKNDLISFLEGRGSEDRGRSRGLMEREILTEVGNILIGACVGKMSELLNTFVTYSPPQVIESDDTEYDFIVDLFDPSQPAIVMTTVFRFKEKDVNGFLLLLTNQESIGWLRRSLNDFMESYE